MLPPIHASLVNGRFGDPAVFLGFRFERRALLLDLGALHLLPARQLLKVEAALVSHAHVDHLIGFDHWLRHLVGRQRTVALLGPAGIAQRIGHKLAGYAWDLVDLYEAELTFAVTEVAPDLSWRRIRFRLSTGFAPEPGEAGAAEDGVVLRLPGLAIRAAPLEHHRTACLGYALAQPAQANIDRDWLERHELPVGPWLARLKQAVLDGASDDHPVPVFARAAEAAAAPARPLGEVRGAVAVTPGMRIGYLTDFADTAANRAAAVALVRDADLLFCEASFAAADATLAARRGHLTTQAAGEIARVAGVRCLEPFHFSPRYEGEEERLLAESAAAFAGDQPPSGTPSRP
ncbi:MBL fold metallo-hydrolase [Roseomonas sp. OT10]|uniref:MBL fold metallo-hydrolase n=1 Tax=Roseomonas cutis TaxID=2897332 RepID=UPI001E505AF8|nr:MBL fold metallo-hydrolase [Roseomonas sp. OT10]UFN50422.1 MBL fold metallo-hydrolase [Roseomonas sp. OT10]